VYNGEKFLKNSIESILNQAFSDFELIIVNDGSTDHTPEIISSYKDPRIKIINNEQNVGLPRSLNKAIALAQGDYIAINDHDDISDRRRLKKQLEQIKQDPKVALVSSPVFVINE
jgi:glycosyltransferase involved in cell wall biosynthesis